MKGLLLEQSGDVWLEDLTLLLSSARLMDGTGPGCPRAQSGISNKYKITLEENKPLHDHANTWRKNILLIKKGKVFSYG